MASTLHKNETLLIGSFQSSNTTKFVYIYKLRKRTKILKSRSDNIYSIKLYVPYTKDKKYGWKSYTAEIPEQYYNILSNEFGDNDILYINSEIIAFNDSREIYYIIGREGVEIDSNEKGAKLKYSNPKNPKLNKECSFTRYTKKNPKFLTKELAQVALQNNLLESVERIEEHLKSINGEAYRLITDNRRLKLENRELRMQKERLKNEGVLRRTNTFP